MRPVKKRAVSHIEEITEQAKREWRTAPLDNLLLAVYVHRLGSLIEKDFESYCQTQFKLRSSDVRVLLALGRAGPPYIKRPTDLFRSLLVSSGAITKQVDRLAKKRLVARFPNPSHGGGLLVQLTDSGRKLVTEVVKALANGSALVAAMQALPMQDRKATERFCYGAIVLLENAPGRAHTKTQSGVKAKSSRKARRLPSS